MPNQGGYTISILVDGKALHEYNADETHGHSADQVRHIEVVEGSEFSIQAQATAETSFPTSCKAFSVNIDGSHMKHVVIRPSDRRDSQTQGWRKEKSGKRCRVSGMWMKQYFQFSRLVTTEEKGDFEMYQKLAKSIGSIRVDIYNATEEDRPTLTVQERTSNPIPEKVLKGRPIDMSAGLGQAKLCAQNVHHRKVTTVGKLLASFVFLYRSRRSLQMLNIIPTTPEPEPEMLQDRDPNTLSLEDARSLVSQYRAKEKSMAKVKREQFHVKSENTDDTKTPKKRTFVDLDDEECQIVSVKKAKPIPKAKVEVLDLT